MRFPRQTFERLRDLLRPIDPDPAQDLFRLKAVERDVILPIKALYLAILVYYFYFTPWAPEPETAQVPSGLIASALTHVFPRSMI